MWSTILVLSVLIIVFFIGLLSSYKDGFIDLSSQQKDYTLRQQKRWGNIGISLTSNKKEGSLGDSANNMLLTYGEKKNYPLDDKRRDLWAMIDKCESIKTMDCGAFDDPQFSLNCGMCLDIGKNSDNVPATGGLVLLPDDKAYARETAYSNFLPEYKATIGFCPAKKMVSTKAECLKLQRELLCEKNSSYDLPGCSQCYSDTNYSIVDPSTSPGVITGSGNMSITGVGLLRIQEQGYDTTSAIPLNVSKPYIYNIRGRESTRIKFVLSPPSDSDPDNPTIPYVSGILSGGTGSGTFTSDLRRIVFNDEVTGRKPRTHGKDTVNGTTVTRMAPGFGQTNASIVIIVPFSFVDTMMEESTMCKDGPFVTTQASAEFLESDPCYKKGSGPGKFTLECLQGAWLSNGCTESGKAYPKDSVTAASLMTGSDGSFLSLNDISDFIYNKALITSTGIDEDGKKQEIKEWSSASVFCTGREITSPCDTPNKDSGPMPPDCIVYLWNNQGSKKLWNGNNDPIGPTYYTSNAVSLFSKGPVSRSCQAKGTLSPTDANGQIKKDIIAYWQKQGGVNNIKRVMADLHRAANAQAASDDQLAPYFKQCYGDIKFAPRPESVFVCNNSAGLPSSYTPVKGNVLKDGLAMTQDYKLDFDLTPTGLTGNWGSIIHFTSDNNDYGAFGRRTPGIWFVPGGMGLHVRIGDANGDHNWGFDNQAGCSVGRRSHISLECVGTSVTLSIDSNVYRLTQPTYRYSGSVKVYGCDPWYDAGQAKVENLCLQLLGNSNVKETNWIEVLKDSSNWKQMDGALTDISISDTGVIFGVNSGDQIWRRDNKNSGWQNLPGSLVQIAAQGADTIVGANRGTYIYRGDGHGGWVNIPGGARWTGAAPDGTTWVVGTNSTQWGNFGFWRKDGSNTANWSSIAGAAKMLSIGTGELWCVQDNGNIFRWTNNAWEIKPKPAGMNVKSVAVSVNGKRIVCIADNGSDGEIFAWNNSNWVKVSGRLKQVAICDTMIIGVSSQDNIFYMDLSPN